MKELILIGGGGHCRSVIDSLNQLDQYKIVGIIDQKDAVGSKVSGVPVIGSDKEVETFFKKGIHNAFVCIGSIASPKARIRVVQQLKAIGFYFPVIIDKTAIVSQSAEIGEGTFVGKGAIINTGTKIGAQCIINTGVIVDHDCTIGGFTHLAPGTTLSGGVKLAERVHVGTNSTVIQGVTVGADTLIGAGSVVVKSIVEAKKAYGNPCREVL